ncbi:MAG: hypothetical protein ACKVP2_01355 [Burkholderiales bacterium]
MKSSLLRPACKAAGVIFCMTLVSGCGGGGGADTSGSNTPAPSTPSSIPANALIAFGTVTLDTANSVGNTGTSNQSGTLVLVSASVTWTATFANNPAAVIPAGTVSDQILRIGDGVGSRFFMSGSSAGAPSTTDGIFSDFWLDIRNPSVSQAVRVTFRAVVNNAVSATGGDAYAFSGLSVRDDGNIEVYFSENRIDTLNPVNNLAEVAVSELFSIVLAPGAVTRISALQNQRGGVNGVGDYSATLDAFIRVESVDLI